ncbi:MAG TPA: hypothetical protein VHR66_17215 [Gemmataceae bacterium]|jgi:hypothetical protein|nr:hypothetical protein [Gemmataceae bacterium]
MLATDTEPTTNDLLMIEYQETVLRQIAERSGLSLAEVGVMAATFLSGLLGRELADVRWAAICGYREWLLDEKQSLLAS